MIGARASRNVILTLLGAGVVGSAAWTGFGGSGFGGTDCRTQRYPSREMCEVSRGAGQCREVSPGGPWAAASCPRYVPRSGSSWFFGSGNRGSTLGSPPTQTRSGTVGRIDAPSGSVPRTGTSGGSSRSGFGSIGASRGSGG